MDKYLCGPKEIIEDAVVIGEEEGGLYKLKGHLETTLFHEITSPIYGIGGLLT